VVNFGGTIEPCFKMLHTFEWCLHGSYWTVKQLGQIVRSLTY
jgi:hypothetical protein